MATHQRLNKDFHSGPNYVKYFFMKNRYGAVFSSKIFLTFSITKQFPPSLLKLAKKRFQSPN